MHKKFFIAIITTMLIFAGSGELYAESFYVGAGDVLEVSVWRDDTLSRELIVPPDGVLSFPLIGDVIVEGLSVAEIRNVIKKKLAEYIPDASVTVILKQINSLKVYVIGQVKNPGQFPITLETHVMQILSEAKGLTPFASERDIHILRYQKDKIEKIGFDYKAVLKGSHLEQDILLKRGDVIVVP